MGDLGGYTLEEGIGRSSSSTGGETHVYGGWETPTLIYTQFGRLSHGGAAVRDQYCKQRS